jgi:putative ABC transport system permease protein
LAAIIGASSILLFGGYIRCIIYGIQTEYVARGGHLQIQHKDYYLFGSGNPAAYGIDDYQNVIDTIKNDPALAPVLRVATASLQFGGIAGNFAAGVSRPIFSTGLIVDDAQHMFTWNDYNFPRRTYTQPLAGSTSDSVVIGIGVARILQLCAPLKVENCPQPAARDPSNQQNAPDDIAALSFLEAKPKQEEAGTHIEILAANAHGAPNVASVNVIKALAQGVKELDDVSIQMHLSQAQRLIYGQSKPSVTSIMIQLNHTGEMKFARARLKELMDSSFKDKSLEILDFSTLNPLYGQAISMFSAIFGFISVLIGAIVLFTVSNTMSMAVVERTVEIGTLRAMGLRHAGIRRLFVCEGFLLGLVGAVLGVISAVGLSILLNHSGITWVPPGRVQSVPLLIWVWGDLRLIFGTVIGLIVVAVISAWWPANRASRMNIVDALRHA